MGISGADEDTSDKLARAEISGRQMRIDLEDRKNLGEGWNLLKPVQIKTGKKIWPQIYRVLFKMVRWFT